MTSLKSIEEIETSLRNTESKRAAPDFIIIDDQSEIRVDEIAGLMHATPHVYADTKIIHFFTPASETLSRQQTRGTAQAGLIRLTKPPRKLRLL